MTAIQALRRVEWQSMIQGWKDFVKCAAGCSRHRRGQKYEHTSDCWLGKFLKTVK